MRLLFVLLALIGATGLNAATVTGLVWQVTGQTYATNITFQPLSTPTINGNAIVTSRQQTKTSADGTFTISLLPSDYNVQIGSPRDSFKISVPTNSDANTYNLKDLITGQLTFTGSSATYSRADADSRFVATTSGTMLGTPKLGSDATHTATVNLNQNSSISVQPGASISVSGDSASVRGEIFLHGTNAFIRFDEGAGINDSVSGQLWQFNKFTITSNQVARFGDTTNISKNVFLNGNTLWVDAAFGNDTTASRTKGALPFASLRAAKNAAQAGDTVVVFPGTYSTNDILKNLVDWHFMPGVQIIYTNDLGTASDALGAGIFDDWSGAVTSSITGSLKILHELAYSIHNSNYFGTFVITNPLSRVNYQFDEMQVHGGWSIGQGMAAVRVKNCGFVTVRGNHIFDPAIVFDVQPIQNLPSPLSDFSGGVATGVYWVAGELYIDIKRINVEGYGVWGNDLGNHTNNLYVTSDYISGNSGSGVYASGCDPQWRMWVTSKEIHSAMYGGISQLYGGKVYVNAQKISRDDTSGGGTAPAGNGGAIILTGTGSCWIASQKVSSTGPWLNTVHQGGTPDPQTNTGPFNLMVNQWEDISTAPYSGGVGMTNGFVIWGSVNVNFIGGGVAKTKFGGGGLYSNSTSNGTIRVQGMVIDTSASDYGTNAPLSHTSTNAFILDRCTLVSAANTWSVFSFNSGRQFINYGSVASHVSTNQTENVQALSVSSAVK